MACMDHAKAAERKRPASPLALIDESPAPAGELGDRDPATQLVTGAFAAPLEVLGGAGCNLSPRMRRCADRRAVCACVRAGGESAGIQLLCNPTHTAASARPPISSHQAIAL